MSKNITTVQLTKESAHKLQLIKLEEGLRGYPQVIEYLIGLYDENKTRT